MGNRVEGAENHCANASPTDAVNPSGAAVSAVSPPAVHHSVQSSRNPLNDSDPARYLTLARCYGVSPHLRSDRGVGATPLGVSKRSVVELSGKDQQIALAEYSRLVVLFLVLGQYLTQLWQVKGQIFGNSMIFQLYRVHISKTIYRSGMGPSPACSPFNSAQNEVF